MGKNAEIKFIYKFYNPNTTIATKDNYVNELLIRENQMIIDNGCCIKKGVIDYHQLGKDGFIYGEESYRSTAALITIFQDLIMPLNEKNNEYTIIMHKSPDLDCMISTYFIKSIIQYGKLPENYKLLIKYAEDDVRGKNCITSIKEVQPFMIRLAINHLIREKHSHIQDDKKWDIIHKEILERGLLLIQYVDNCFSQIDIKSRCTSNNGIFCFEELFSEEIQFLHEDYKQYSNEVKDDTICKIETIMLPSGKGQHQTLKEVDALYWKQKSRAQLNRYWAYKDNNSPKGAGYGCLIEPISQSRIMDNLELTLNRARILVNPSLDIHLNNLGRYIQKKEDIKAVKLREYLRQNEVLLQSIEDQHYKEVLRNFLNGNIYGWYDGKQHNYTVVEMSMHTNKYAYSFLSINEIIESIQDFTKPIIMKCDLKYIIRFNHSMYVKLRKFFIKNNEKFEPVSYADDRVEKFLPYIQNAIYGELKKDTNKSDNCYVAKLFDNKKLSNFMQENITEQCEPELNKIFLNTRLNNINFKVFDNNIGYLTLDAELTNESLNEDDLLILNNYFQNNFDYIFNKIISSLDIPDVSAFTKKRLITPMETFIYSTLQIEKESYYKSGFYKTELNKLLYKLCNPIKLNSNLTSFDFEGNNSSPFKMVLKNDEFSLYGFGKSGGTMIIMYDEHDNQQKRLEYKTLIEEFQTVDFDILTFSLYHRHFLMNYSGKLAIYNSKKNKIKKLREETLRFTTKKWFSQISNDSIIMTKYKRWQDIFENEIIYDEVKRQISEADEYYRGERTSEYEKVSILLIPLVIIGLFFDIKIFDSKTTYLFENSGIVYETLKLVAKTLQVPIEILYKGILNIGIIDLYIGLSIILGWYFLRKKVK